MAVVTEFVLPFAVGADYLIVMNGSDLLAAYRDAGSESAFSDLVRRYTNLVYSIAKRRLSNGPLAEEVTQTVFTRLARAALKIKGDAELVAWLHRTTVHVAIDVWRSETRRRTREQHAAAMEPVCAEDDRIWDEIAPRLDEALNEINDVDRQAVLLRFFQRKPMTEVGRALGVSEDAAKMRVSRAIDRLRTQLSLRGVTCAVGIVASLVTERSIQAAPGHLVASLGSAKFAVGAATTLSSFSVLLALMAKAKFVTALIVFAAVGIGVIGTLRILNSSTSSNNNVVATSGTQDPANSSRQLRPRPAFGRVAGNDVAAEAAQIPDSAELEDLKRELRALLQKPPAANRNPSPELRRVLEKFGYQIHEAVPILLEALNVQDHETRVWALSGLNLSLHLLRQWPALQERADKVFALARPALSKILASPGEPSMLRLMAMQSYLSPIIYKNGAPVNPPAPLSAERTEDLVAALRARDKLSGGIRYLIVNRLAEHFGQYPEDAATFVSELQPLLNDSQPHQRLLAAFALACWPGERESAVKAELLAELKDRKTSHTHLAAEGLGKLGAQAADAVPALLAYAEATKDLGNGTADGALEAACRLQPDLRTRYPSIDAKLKQEENAISRGAETTKVYGPGEVANVLADPEQGPALLDSLISVIKNRVEPEKARESLVSLLEKELQQASESQRAAVQSAIDAVRLMDTSANSEVTEKPPMPMTQLVLHARLMLQEGNNPNESRLERALDEFHMQHVRNVTDANVTTERYRVLSAAIRDIDPEFQAQWRKQVLKNYPWLDRVLQPEEQ